MAMENSGTSDEMAGIEAREQAVRRSIHRWLRAWLIRYFRDDTKQSGFNGTRAHEALGWSQSFISDLTRTVPSKSPSLDVLIRMREMSGASYEEITGHRPPPKPRFPWSTLPYGLPLAESAADEASSLDHERQTSMRGNVKRKVEAVEANGGLIKAHPRAPELLVLVRANPTRWSAAAIAAALTLPPAARTGVEAWAKLLDAFDDAIREIVVV